MRRDGTICEAKTKALISCGVSAPLFSHVQMLVFILPGLTGFFSLHK